MKSRLSLIALILTLLFACAPQGAPTEPAPVDIANAALVADASMPEPTTVAIIEPTTTPPALQSPNGGMVSVDGVIYSENGTIFLRLIVNHTKNSDSVKTNTIGNTWVKMSINQMGPPYFHDDWGFSPNAIDLLVTNISSIHIEFIDACSIDLLDASNVTQANSHDGAKISANCVY